MTIVRPFEADLLHVLHAILGRGPGRTGRRAIERATPAPSCLSRDALALIEETIALGSSVGSPATTAGAASGIAKGMGSSTGGSGGGIRRPNSGSDFTERSMEFLIRLTEGTLEKLSIDRQGLSLGDQLLLFLAWAAFRRTKHRSQFLNRSVIRKHGLCRLAFPADFSEKDKLHAAEFDPWFGPGRAWVVESLQGTLADAWVESENWKWEGTTRSGSSRSARNRSG